MKKNIPPVDLDLLTFAVNTAKEIKDGLIKSGVTLLPLDQLKKFA